MCDKLKFVGLLQKFNISIYAEWPCQITIIIRAIMFIQFERVREFPNRKKKNMIEIDHFVTWHISPFIFSHIQQIQWPLFVIKFVHKHSCTPANIQSQVYK